jgi:hypothetical protein
MRYSTTRWAFALILAALAATAFVGVVRGDRAAAVEVVQRGCCYLLIF